MGWQGTPVKPSWETVARRLMVATRRFVDAPNTGNQETLTETLRDCEKLTQEDEESLYPKTNGWK